MSSAPTITSVLSGNGYAIVLWAPPASPGGTITAYTVTSTPGGITATTADGSTLYATVSGLTNGTSYTFTCAAIVGGVPGTASSPSSAVIPYTVPNPPTLVSATAADSQITATWIAGNNGGAAITSFLVTASSISVTASSSATSAAITGLTNGQVYTISIQAVNAAGASASSNTIAATPYAAPGAPTITSVEVDCALATVTWSAPTNTGGSPITGYTVTTTPSSTTLTTASTTFTATFTGLTNGTAYTLRVAAVNAIGTGASATSSSVTPVISPYIQYKLRRGTANAWTAANPVLADGEVALETDTKQLKVGDGITAWSVLAYNTMLGRQGPLPNYGANRILLSDGADAAVGNAALTYSNNILYTSSLSAQGGIISSLITSQYSTINLYTNTLQTNTITSSDDLRIATSTVTVNGDIVAAGEVYNTQMYNMIKYDTLRFGKAWISEATGYAWNNIAASVSAQYQVATTDISGVNSYIYLSNNYGNTWSRALTISVAQQILAEIAMSASGQYIAAVTYGYNGSTYAVGSIYQSADYGATWASTQNTQIWQGVSISASGRYRTAVARVGVIYVSSDYGTTWSASNIANSSLVYRNVALSASGQYQTAVSETNLFTSSDYGQSWTSRATTTATWVRVRISWTGRYQTALAQGGNIWVSSNYGVTWLERPYSGSWYGLAMSATGQYQIAATLGASVSPFTSVDYGQTWTSTGTAKSDWRGFVMSASGEYTAAAQLGGSLWTSQIPMQFTANVNTLSLGIGVQAPFSTISVLLLASDSAYKPGSSAWTIASDERIKTDVVPADINTCYSNIQALNLRHFAWDPNVYDSNVVRDRHVLGFIAQEVQHIFPKSVEIFPEFTLGGSTFTNFHTLSIDQIANANIGAVQRLMQMVDSRQSTIDGFGLQFAAQQSTFASLFELQISTLRGISTAFALSTPLQENP